MLFGLVELLKAVAGSALGLGLFAGLARLLKNKD